MTRYLVDISGPLGQRSPIGVVTGRDQVFEAVATALGDRKDGTSINIFKEYAPQGGKLDPIGDLRVDGGTFTRVAFVHLIAPAGVLVDGGLTVDELQARLGTEFEVVHPPAARGEYALDL